MPTGRWVPRGLSWEAGVSPGPSPPTRSHSHPQTHITHTNIHTFMHAHSHIQTHSHLYSQTHTHTHTYTRPSLPRLAQHFPVAFFHSSCWSPSVGQVVALYLVTDGETEAEGEGASSQEYDQLWRCTSGPRPTADNWPDPSWPHCAIPGSSWARMEAEVVSRGPALMAEPLEAAAPPLPGPALQASLSL